jgi:lysyl-tRNA synthetase class 2
MGEQSINDFFELVDTGDFIEFTGRAYVTKRETNALSVTSWRLLTKSLRPIPDSFYGIEDEDERYRKRYLDFILNKDNRDMMKRRSMFWNTIRGFLLARDYIEVETPVLENTTGGADARPFVTHHNALDMDVYLRISAGELWQKRLLIAGLPKTFEIGRIFRNEGMSAEHAQDYTQVEFYEAYSDFTKGMQMTKELYIKIGEEVYGKTEFTHKGLTFDLKEEWAIYDFSKIIKEKFNIDVHTTNVDEVEKELKNNEIEYDKKTLSVERGIDLLWKKVRKTLAGPGFLVGIPVYLEPLAKKSVEDERVVERFQVILAGSELGKGFSELNDPIDQRERFMSQQALRDAGDDEAQMADLEYVEAMEYGMPPAFGFGVSERLFSFLEGKSVRECQAFPLMRKKN